MRKPIILPLVLHFNFYTLHFCFLHIFSVKKLNRNKQTKIEKFRGIKPLPTHLPHASLDVSFLTFLMRSLWKIPIPQQFRQPKADLEITLGLDYLRGNATPSSMSPKSFFWNIFQSKKKKRNNENKQTNKQTEPPNQPTNKQKKPTCFQVAMKEYL